MCIGCPDFVDYCGDEACKGPELLSDGQPNKRRLRMFYLDSPAFCEHLTAEYGTALPGLADHLRRGHDGEGCQCITETWWPLEQIRSAEAAARRQDAEDG